MWEITKRCNYCDKKFVTDELNPDYKCPSCRKNNIDNFVATKR
jgi:predicted Zn-ribbon and HTH transcriptional regulator